MNIQLAPWKNSNDWMVKNWASPYEEGSKLDDTEKAGALLKDYLVSLGHDVTVTLDLPPHNERFYSANDLDLFLGVGAGDPVSPGFGNGRDRRALGVETAYPVAWIGPSVITSHPFSAFYRAYARDLTGDLILLNQGLNPEPVALDDRERRDTVIRLLADKILEWRDSLTIPVKSNDFRSVDEQFEYDIFLCFNSADRDQINAIYKKLTDSGLRIFIDSEEVKPGQRHQQQVGNALKSSKSVAVCFGASGIGPWQSHEVEEAIAEHNARQLPVIPVLLQGCPDQPNLPFALGNFSWIDVRQDSASEIDRLIESVAD